MHAGSAEVDESIYHTENCPPLVEQHLGDAPRPLEQPPGEAGGGLIYRGGLALSLKRSDDTVDKRFGQLRTRRRVPSQWRLQAQEDTRRCVGCDAAGPDVQLRWTASQVCSRRFAVANRPNATFANAASRTSRCQ